MVATAASTNVSGQLLRPVATRDSKYNGIVRRRCICGHADLCQQIWKFWSGPIDATGTCRDKSKAGHVRIPCYKFDETTPLMEFQNKKRIVYFAHLLPKGSQEASESRNGRDKTHEYIALHHFPAQYLKQDGTGLATEVVLQDKAKILGLTTSDLFVAQLTGGYHRGCSKDAVHEHNGKYILPPNRKWNDIVMEFTEKGGSLSYNEKKSTQILPSDRTRTKLINCMKRNPELFVIEYERMENEITVLRQELKGAKQDREE